MKKFIVTWHEKVLDQEGDFLHLEQKKMLIDAENEDRACDLWEEKTDPDLCTRGILDCYETIDDPLLNKAIVFCTDNGVNMAVQVESVVRHKAIKISKTSTMEYSEILKQVVEQFRDKSELYNYAKSIDWNEIAPHVFQVEKKVSEQDLKSSWENQQKIDDVG